MKRYPREFPDLATDAGEAVESVRKALDVTVSDVALLEDRLPDDPPRTARIGITYTAGTPEQALTMARELANLVVSSTLRREDVTAQNDQAAATALLGRSEKLFDQTADESSTAAAGNSITEALRAQARAESARQNLRAAVAAATNARLATRAQRGAREPALRRWSTPDGCRPGGPGATSSATPRACCCWRCSGAAFSRARSIRGFSIAVT